MSEHKPSDERRVGQVAIPEDMMSELNELQHQTLARLEGFGWSVGFVRRPLFQDRVIMLFDPSGQQHAVLNDDGSINKSTDTQVR